MENREILEVNIEQIINENENNKKFITLAKTKIMDKGVSAGEFAEIWNHVIPMQDISIVMLYIFTQALYSITQNGKIKPEKYFTPTEIKDGRNIKIENREEPVEYPIVFKNVLKGREDQYLFFLPIGEVKKLYDSQLISYNFETQREPRLTYNKKDDEIIKSINIVASSVKEISESLTEGSFITNTITLNLLADGTDHFTYDKGVLTIEAGQINVLDGFHRIMGMITAASNNENIDYITEVRFTNFTIAKAKRFIVQEDKRNKINKRYIHTNLDTNKIGSKVVNRLNESESDIKGKITHDAKLVKLGKAYTLGSIMSDCIDAYYDIKTNYDVQTVTDWLGEFFDIIIGLQYNEFSNIIESRERSVITLPATFAYYIACSKLAYDNGKTKAERRSIVEKMLERTDFSISNPDWDFLNIIDPNKIITIVKKQDLKKIIAYAETKRISY